MTKHYEHLYLPLYPQSYNRQPRKGRSSYTSRSKASKIEYLSIQTERLDELKEVFVADKSQYQDFVDPNLIFLLEITQRVDEDSMRKDLQRMEIEVLASSPDKSGGLWVVFSSDEELQKFRDKLQVYAEKDGYSFFDVIGLLKNIPLEEKIGLRLDEQPLTNTDMAYLDLEIWRMDDERLNKFIRELKDFILARNGRLTDQFLTDNFCLLRVYLNLEILNEILPLREIASVDRPPRPYIDYTVLNTDFTAVSLGDPPSSDATAIAVIDSGLLSGHPLLKNAVGDAITIGTQYSDHLQDDQVVDDVGHGTKVSGIALYGDLRTCLDQKVFKPEVWILSAKVMYSEKNPSTGQVEAKYDEEELLEHQLERAVRYFVERYPNCKVVNLSLGDKYKRMFGQQRQFNLAALVDELARELKLLFVISVGNFSEFDQSGFPETYPNYLLDEETDTVKLIDPATSALGLTVGAITPPYGPFNRHQSDAMYSPAKTHFPAPFTRVGLGHHGMIKPELVEVGGNVIRTQRPVLPDLGGQIITLNPKWMDEGRLFTVDYGTSFCTPKVAHIAAKLFNQYPHYSPNLIKALLLSSAQMPNERPIPLDRIRLEDSDKELSNLLKVYGYGQPDFNQACYSNDRGVILLRENEIKLNKVDVYYFYLPPEFIEISGRKRLAVTLVFDPPINKNRLDYLGCTLDFRLFKNMEIQEVVQAYNAIQSEDLGNEESSEKLKMQEIILHPKSSLRKKGGHQRGIKEYSKRPKLNWDRPLVLAVVCQNRWIKDEHYQQGYGLAVTVEHETEIDLFNRIQARIQNRARITM